MSENPLEKWRAENPDWKPVYKNPVEKLADAPNSLRRAVNAKCWQCEGEDADPGVKWRIGNCLIKDCALYNVRPHQNLKDTPMPKALREVT